MFFFSSRRRHTRSKRDWSSDVCSSDLIDHVEEHTVQMVLDSGFWAGMTLYPESKCTSARAVDMVEMYGNERIWMRSEERRVGKEWRSERWGVECRKRK